MALSTLGLFEGRTLEECKREDRVSWEGPAARRSLQSHPSVDVQGVCLAWCPRHAWHPPLCHVPGCLQEACVVVLLQDVLGLVDEDRGALQTLPAVGDLLGQLPQLHHLPGEQSCSETTLQLGKHRASPTLSQGLLRGSKQWWNGTETSLKTLGKGSCNHLCVKLWLQLGIMEWFGLKGPLDVIQSNPCAARRDICN